MKMCNGEVAVDRWWRRLVVAAAAGTSTLLATATVTQAQPSPCQQNCADVTVGDATIGSGGTGSVAIGFAQAPSNGQSGGPDEIAAIAFTLQIGGQLRLADCALDENGLPAAVTKAAGLSNFRVVVENASCTA